MLPFLEENVTYNSINFNVASKWGGFTNSDLIGIPFGSTVDCDTFGLINATASTTRSTSSFVHQIPAFRIKASSSVAPFGNPQRIGYYNYPINGGTNPFRSSGILSRRWRRR